jgi:hypothetical protein
VAAERRPRPLEGGVGVAGPGPGTDLPAGVTACLGLGLVVGA